jgi:hypothetical protein
MHSSGYGFHAQASVLMMAALIWKNGLRTFRLVRSHEAKLLRQGIAKVNLASLPEEILRMIEDDLVAFTHTQVDYEFPFSSPCQCDDVWNLLHDSVELEITLDEFASALHLDPDHPDTYDAFFGTPGFDTVFDIAMDRHLEGDAGCEAQDAELKYWHEVVLHLQSKDRNIHQKVSDISSKHCIPTNNMWQ